MLPRGRPPYLGTRMVEEVAGAKFLHVPHKGFIPGNGLVRKD